MLGFLLYWKLPKMQTRLFGWMESAQSHQTNRSDPFSFDWKFDYCLAKWKWKREFFDMEQQVLIRSDWLVKEDHPWKWTTLTTGSPRTDFVYFHTFSYKFEVQRTPTECGQPVLWPENFYMEGSIPFISQPKFPKLLAWWKETLRVDQKQGDWKQL